MNRANIYVNKLEILERAKLLKNASTPAEELRRTARANPMKQCRYTTLEIEHIEVLTRNKLSYIWKRS
ncbi:hypothetical protein B6N13_06930 [Marinomonas sp. UCMA 3892]|nr:hypothetical protein [Marinomonas sp. UCMA 3892]